MYSSVKGIILDFDGTIFRLFTDAYDLGRTAQTLHALLEKYGIDFSPERDAFESFYTVVSSDKDENVKKEILRQVDNIVTTAEIEALSSGILVEGFDYFLKEVKKHGKILAIVSNNSEKCINTFLSEHKIEEMPVLGRIGTHPELMKPHAYLLEAMCANLGLAKDEVVFVGDNPRDYQCAENFGCKFIALTPTERKKNRFVKAVPRVQFVEDFYGLSKLIFN